MTPRDTGIANVPFDSEHGRVVAGLHTPGAGADRPALPPDIGGKAGADALRAASDDGDSGSVVAQCQAMNFSRAALTWSA